MYYVNYTLSNCPQLPRAVLLNVLYSHFKQPYGCNTVHVRCNCGKLRGTFLSSTVRRSLIYYSLFTFSWPRFERESLRNGGMLISRVFFAVDGMHIEIYGESWISGLLTSDDVILYMAGFVIMLRI